MEGLEARGHPQHTEEGKVTCISHDWLPHPPWVSAPTWTVWSGKLSLRCCISRKVSFQFSVSNRFGKLEGDSVSHDIHVTYGVT